ncbi:hypothetical protein M2146_001101 [Lachnospiraceae bacterium PF1-22]
MSKHVDFLSDYTGEHKPNYLHITQRNDGDIVIWTSIHPENQCDKGIQITASGSRLRKNKAEIIKKFSEIIDLLNEEQQENNF